MLCKAREQILPRVMEWVWELVSNALEGHLQEQEQGGIARAIKVRLRPPQNTTPTHLSIPFSLFSATAFTYLLPVSLRLLDPALLPNYASLVYFECISPCLRDLQCCIGSPGAGGCLFPPW